MILDWLALHYSLEMLISLLLCTNLVITLLLYNYENSWNERMEGWYICFRDSGDFRSFGPALSK